MYFKAQLIDFISIGYHPVYDGTCSSPDNELRGHNLTQGCMSHVTTGVDHHHLAGLNEASAVMKHGRVSRRSSHCECRPYDATAADLATNPRISKALFKVVPERGKAQSFEFLSKFSRQRGRNVPNIGKHY